LKPKKKAVGLHCGYAFAFFMIQELSITVAGFANEVSEGLWDFHI
jgi:hypothetical protein